MPEDNSLVDDVLIRAVGPKTASQICGRRFAMKRASVELKSVSIRVFEEWAVRRRTIFANISTRNRAETAEVAHQLFRLIAYTRSTAMAEHDF